MHICTYTTMSRWLDRIEYEYIHGHIRIHAYIHVYMCMYVQKSIGSAAVLQKTPFFVKKPQPRESRNFCPALFSRML